MNHYNIETFKQLTELDPAEICDVFYSIVSQLCRQALFQLEQLFQTVFPPDVLNAVWTYLL